MNATTPHSLTPVYVPLRLAYGIVPVVAGLDKFTNLLADWPSYLPAFATQVLPLSPSALMMLVGVIEIVAGLAVLTAWTRLGAYVVAAWLVLVALAVAAAGFLDIAVRDLVMAVGAYCLGQVAALRGDAWLPGREHTERTSHHAPAG